MIRVIGVRFRQAGKIYYFDPVDFDIEVGQHVIVETARGIEYGLVLTGPREVEMCIRDSWNNSRLIFSVPSLFGVF